jgi:pimeloyl-ACP methyl ester carboxylesterase
MRYFVWGSGPPVVFVHGMADAARAFVMVMHRLVGRYMCIAYELPDGTTDGSALGRYTLASYAADVVALLDHLNLPRAAVVGSSFGSLGVLTALTTHPDRFTQVILQNGFAHRPLNRFQRQLARSARFWPGWFADWPAIHRRVMWYLERPTLSAMSPFVAETFLEHAGRTPIRAAALRALTIHCADLRPCLTTIRMPVLLTTGDQDRLVPRSCWEELERSLPHRRRVEFAGCGHYPQYTHPREMAEAIGAFLGERRP